MRRRTTFLAVLTALVAAGGMSVCLPVDGVTGAVPADVSPSARLDSAHAAGIAAPATLACALADFRFLRPENLYARRPGSRKGLSDEDDDHSTPEPVAGLARPEEENDRLQDGTSRHNTDAGPQRVRLEGSDISRERLWNGQVIPSLPIRHRRAHAPRDRLATGGDPEDNRPHARPFHPFRSRNPDSLHRSRTDPDAACREGVSRFAARRPGQPDAVRRKVGA